MINEKELSNSQLWRLMIEEVKQKALVRYGEKYIVILSALGDKPYEAVENFFKAERPPTLSTFVALNRLVDDL
ncbi:MAG: hypothetical protein DRQ35_07295 [Gammaproteobacteria bacterium]|nr:MAG: hypothetical protein DRQ35_07295 [Gammaproteobacteria bacterium]